MTTGLTEVSSRDFSRVSCGNSVRSREARKQGARSKEQALIIEYLRYARTGALVRSVPANLFPRSRMGVMVPWNA
jgi:hypothetical protein